MYFGFQNSLSVAYRQRTINKKGAVMRKSHTSFFEIKFCENTHMFLICNAGKFKEMMHATK